MAKAPLDGNEYPHTVLKSNALPEKSHISPEVLIRDSPNDLSL